MENDKYEALGPIYAAIGEECMSIIGHGPDSLYLYAEAGEGYSGGAIFVDEGHMVRCYGPSPELFDLILEAWTAEGEDEKWELMEYEIKGGSFSAHMIYPEQIDHDLSISQLRETYLTRRFGDKPVLYPPLPDYMMEVK